MSLTQLSLHQGELSKCAPIQGKSCGPTASPCRRKLVKQTRSHGQTLLLDMIGKNSLVHRGSSKDGASTEWQRDKNIKADKIELHVKRQVASPALGTLEGINRAVYLRKLLFR